MPEGDQNTCDADGHPCVDQNGNCSGIYASASDRYAYSDAFDPQSWQTKRLLYETEEGDGEAALIDHLLSHLSSPLWPTQVSAIARAYS